jgi:hypothetical protein
MGACSRRVAMHVGAVPLQLTRWVLRTARLRAPATQPRKGVAWEGRGTSCTALAVGSGGS